MYGAKIKKKIDRNYLTVVLKRDQIAELPSLLSPSYQFVFEGCNLCLRIG